MYSGKAQGLSTVDSVVSALMGSYDVQNFKMWRLDDVEYVRQRQQWREDDVRRRHAWRLQDIERVRRLEKLANERCLIDIRTEQLLHISQISIVVAYFARVAYVESQIPDNGNPVVVALQGSSAALGVLCMIMCMIIVVLIQIAVARYATEDLEDQLRAVKIEHLDVVSPFTQWWLLRCEKDWHMAFTLFRTGIVLVLLTIGFLSWLQYTKSFGVGVSISTLSGLTLIYWFCRMQPRWPEVHAFPMHDD